MHAFHRNKQRSWSRIYKGWYVLLVESSLISLSNLNICGFRVIEFTLGELQFSLISKNLGNLCRCVKISMY